MIIIIIKITIIIVFKLRSIIITYIRMSIPWTVQENLYNFICILVSKPCTVTLKNVFVVIENLNSKRLIYM